MSTQLLRNLVWIIYFFWIFVFNLKWEQNQICLVGLSHQWYRYFVNFKFVLTTISMIFLVAFVWIHSILFLDTQEPFFKDKKYQTALKTLTQSILFGRNLRLFQFKLLSLIFRRLNNEQADQHSYQRLVEAYTLPLVCCDVTSRMAKKCSCKVIERSGSYQ